MAHLADVAGWFIEGTFFCTRGTCLPDDFKEENADAVLWANRDDYPRGLQCVECKDDIFEDTHKITIGYDTPLTCFVNIERYAEGDKHPVWTGKAYTATILVDGDKNEDAEKLIFWTECIYHPSPSRAFYDILQMLEYGDSKEYPTPYKLLESYSLNDVQNAVLFTSRWYEARFLHAQLSAFFGDWFKDFIAGDYHGEVD